MALGQKGHSVGRTIWRFSSFLLQTVPAHVAGLALGGGAEETVTT